VPRAGIPRARLAESLGRDLSDDELRELLWSTKAEFDGSDGGTLAIEATADRLDLLTEAGLALALAPKLGGSRGGVPVPPGAWDGAAPAFEVDPSVRPLRPGIAGVVLQAPAGRPLDAGLLDEAIRFQELLHATYGGNRRRASLGIYPTRRFRFPVRYRARPIDEVRFVPLDGTTEVGGREFLADHPMAATYGALGTSDGRMLVLEDADGTVLSLPPILNSRTSGEARPGDASLLLESTGTTIARVRESVGLLALVFLAHGWSAVPVAIHSGSEVDDGRSVLAPRRVPLSLSTLDALSGRTYTVPETEHLLAECRLTGHPVPGGFAVDVPPWRPDILTEVDVAEDIVLARGVRAEDGVVPPSPVRGRRLPEAVFRRRVAELLVGLGHTEVFTPLLVGREVDALIAPSYAIALANPVSDLFSHLRNRLLPSLLTSLAHNVRHAYPQRFFEVGPVVVRDPSVETGGRTIYRAGAILAGERASFADGAALLDALTGAVAALGVREPVEIPGTILGRAARLRLAGEAIGEVGELHPSVLTALRVPVPAVWAELDLSAIWPLVRRASEGP
jgi:phenylalanyl-tRNA synthetase beta chain